MCCHELLRHTLLRTTLIGGCGDAGLVGCSRPSRSRVMADRASAIRWPGSRPHPERAPRPGCPPERSAGGSRWPSDYSKPGGAVADIDRDDSGSRDRRQRSARWYHRAGPVSRGSRRPPAWWTRSAGDPAAVRPRRLRPTRRRVLQPELWCNSDAITTGLRAEPQDTPPTASRTSTEETKDFVHAASTKWARTSWPMSEPASVARISCHPRRDRARQLTYLATRTEPGSVRPRREFPQTCGR